jgi:hypothetical protein
MSYTDHYNLQRLTTDDLSENSFKFSEGDRVLIDALLYAGAEGHHHTGGASTANAPTSAPALTLDTSSGDLPASKRIYYKFTYVDGSGVETTASPESYIDTPSAVAAPAAPVLSTNLTGGTLQPGNYFYILTAYDTFNSLETTGGTAGYLSIPYTTTTNTITLTMPVLPSGATGFNIYRKGPASSGYRYLTSVTGSSYVDTGSVGETQTRLLPTGNTTTSSNSVEIALPGATPALPGVGYFWRIYRTFVPSDYTNSLLTTTNDVTFIDTGLATTVGQPPTAGTSIGSPAKIQLTGAAEVQGYLPTGNIEDFTETVQDILGAMATDTATINVSYDDSTGLITFDVVATAVSMPATQVSYAGNTDLQSATVEAALDELDKEKLSRFGGVRHGQVTAGNAGAAATIDLSYGNVIRYTLNSATATFTFPTVAAAGAGATPTVFAHEFWLILTQDATGSRLASWPLSVKWGTAGAPTLSTGAGKVDIFRFMSPDQGTSWYGVTWGLGF